MRYLFFILIIIPIVTFSQKESLLITHLNDTIHCKFIKPGENFTFYRTFESNLVDSIPSKNVKQIIGADLVRELNKQKRKNSKPTQQITFTSDTSQSGELKTSSIIQKAEMDYIIYQNNLASYYFEKASINLLVGVGCGVLAGTAAILQNEYNTNNINLEDPYDYNKTGYYIAYGLAAVGFVEMVIGFVQIGQAGKAMNISKHKISFNINNYGPTIGFKF